MLDNANISDKISVLFRRDVPPHTAVVIVLLAVAVGALEWLLFEEYTQAAILGYCVALLVISLAPLVSDVEASIFQVFILIPVFRLVNFTMPVFFELTLLWFPLIYAPFIPACLPWWFRTYRNGKLRGLLKWGNENLALPQQETSPARSALHWLTRIIGIVLFVVVAISVLIGLFMVTVHLAEIEYGLTDPSPLITSLDHQQVALLTVVMIGFVGFVEELLFRGIIQQELETRLGLVPGLLLTSLLFAAMHATHAVPVELVFAGGIGLLFGIVYDITGSLSLVSAMHGVLNVFLFGVIPLSGVDASELLQALVRNISGIL